MELLHTLHTAVVVSDLAKAQHFYGNVLGLPLVTRPTRLNFPGCWYQLGEYQIHLIVGDGVTNDGHKSDKWGRRYHLAIAVADIKATKAHLAAHGWPIQESSSGRPAVFVQDPDGYVIELAQVSDSSS